MEQRILDVDHNPFTVFEKNTNQLRWCYPWCKQHQEKTMGSTFQSHQKKWKGATHGVKSICFTISTESLLHSSSWNGQREFESWGGGPNESQKKLKKLVHGGSFLCLWTTSSLLFETLPYNFMYQPFNKFIPKNNNLRGQWKILDTNSRNPWTVFCSGFALSSLDFQP